MPQPVLCSEYAHGRHVHHEVGASVESLGTADKEGCVAAGGQSACSEVSISLASHPSSLMYQVEGLIVLSLL